MIEKEIYSAKNDPTIDAGIGLQQLYREALDNGFKGSLDDFIRSAPKKLLRTILKDGGDVKENSYAQLIDDYDKNIDDSNKIRSSTGLNAGWTSPVGPMSFIFSKNLTKAATDVTEGFNFRLGTTF